MWIRRSRRLPWRQTQGQDDQVVFWASQVGVMLLQQCQSRDFPIELRTVRHHHSNIAVDGVGGDLW